jgi:glutathione S-transferase
MITLYRFPYSCYALKVQLLLDKLSLPYQIKEVPFGDRSELVKITNGRVQVPVIVHHRDDGSEKMVIESRDICRYLLGLKSNNLVPPGSEGLIWAYCDWVDEVLEDPLFKMVSLDIANRFERDADRAMFIFIKERKFGQGCVHQWSKDKSGLLQQARDLLAETLMSIAHNGFIHGETPTLADIALVGHLSMVEWADQSLIEAIDPLIPSYMERVRTH